jgi:hypothetical protein
MSYILYDYVITFYKCEIQFYMFNFEVVFCCANIFYMVLNFEIHFYIIIFFCNFILISVGVSFFYGVTLWNFKIVKSNFVCLCYVFSFLF